MKSLLTFLILSAAFLSAQNVRVDGVVQGRTGAPSPGASIAVCYQPANTTTTPCSPLALLCSSLSDAACTMPNPVTADGLGNYFFYLLPGLYTYQFYGSGLSTRVQPDQSVGTGITSPPTPATAQAFPSSVNFGTVQTGQSVSGNVTLQNTSAAASVVFSGITFSGANASDFSSTNPTGCNGTQLAGVSCIIPVTFTPSTATTESATLTINSTIGPITVPLSGTGQATPSFTLTVSPSGSGSGSVQSGDGTPNCALPQICVAPTISASMTGPACNGSCSSSYPSGTVVVLTATPTTGNTFDSFTGGGCSSSPCSVTVSSNILVKTSFTPIPVSFTLNVIPNGQGTGLVTSDIGGVSCTSIAGVLSGTCSAAYPQGTHVVLTEAPSTTGNGTCVGANCTFTSWGGISGCNMATTCAVTMSATSNVSATFAAPTATAPVQQIQTINGGTPGTNSITGNFSQAQTLGNTNIVWILTNSAASVSSITDTLGNTYTLAACGGGTNPQANLFLYYSLSIAAAGAGANTITVALSAAPTYRVILASEYSGLLAFDACHGANGSGTALDSGAFTTTVGNDLLIGGDNVAHGISVVSSGWTQEISNSGNDVEDQKNVAAAAYHFLPTQAPTGTWQAIGAGFTTGAAISQIRFSFTIQGAGAGTGTVSAAGISCTITNGVPSGTCSTSVASGGTLTLTASPASGSTFSTYSGAGCGTTPTCVTSAINTNTLTTVTFGVPQAGGPFDILHPPPPSNRPYPRAYFNQKLPNAGNGGPTGHLMPGSDANIVPTVMKNGGSSLVTSSGFWNSPGSDDGQHRAFYYGQASDPVYQVSGCSGPSTSTSVNGQKFHAPSGAPYNQGSFDKEIAIWDQTSDIMFQFYGGASGPGFLPACAGTIGSPCNMPAYGGYCSAVNHTTGAGYDGGNAASTAGLAPMANIIRLTEIYQVGHINHGLRGVTTCTDTDNGTYPSKVVFPANVPSGSPSNTCANAGVSATNRPPNGALFFLDYTQAQLNCFDPTQGTCGGVNKLTPWQFALIEAATFYGITLEDTGNGSSISLPGIESEQGYQFADTHGYPGARAQSDAFTNFMVNNCSGVTCNSINRCPGTGGNLSTQCANGHSQMQWGINAWANISNQGGLDIIGHMHVADPCVAIAMQGLANDGHGTNACP